jgi:hypothetical protein
MILSNGATALRYVVRGKDGIVLAHYKGEPGEYVVWHCFQNEKGVWICDTGHYYLPATPESFQEALKCFAERAINFMGFYKEIWWYENYPCGAG